MKKISFFLFVIFSFSTSLVFSQTSKNLDIKTSFFKETEFYQNGFRINSRTAELALRTNQKAFQLYQKSNSLANGSTLFGAIGGVLIGWPVGTAIGGGDPVWELAAVGAGFTVISAVIFSSAQKNAKSAVELYNSGLASSYYQKPETEIRLVATPAQLGFSISF